MTTSTANLQTFDPSGVGLDNGNLYGLPCDYDTAGIVIFGVPWEATVSYHQGTAQGPQRVLEASPQLDLVEAPPGAATVVCGPLSVLRFRYSIPRAQEGPRPQQPARRGG